MAFDIRIHGTAADVWAFLWDADALGRVLPGCESIQTEGAGRFRVVLAMPTAFLTIRADAIAEIHDPDPHRSALLTLDGTPRGLGGRFSVRIPLAFTEEAGPEGTSTRIAYDVEVQVSGGLATFGPAVLRDAIVGEVRGLAADIETEIAAGRVPARSE